MRAARGLPARGGTEQEPARQSREEGLAGRATACANAREGGRMAHSKFISSKLDAKGRIHSTHWKWKRSRLPKESALESPWPWPSHLLLQVFQPSRSLCPKASRTGSRACASLFREILLHDLECWVPHWAHSHLRSPFLLIPTLPDKEMPTLQMPQYVSQPSPPGARCPVSPVREGGGEPGDVKDMQPCLGPAEGAAAKKPVLWELVGGKTRWSPRPSQTTPGSSPV